MTGSATVTPNVEQISSRSNYETSDTSTLSENALLTSTQRRKEYILRQNQHSLRVTTGLPAPSWLEESLDQIQKVLNLRCNWNSYGAPSVSIDAAYAALEILPKIAPFAAPAPSIVPTVDGGVQIEWHEGGIDLEIEVLPRIQAVVYLADASSGEEWEDGLDLKRCADVRKCLERLSA